MKNMSCAGDGRIWRHPPLHPYVCNLADVEAIVGKLCAPMLLARFVTREFEHPAEPIVSALFCEHR